MFRFIQLKNVCSSTAKAHPHLLNGLSECIPSTDIPYVSAIKRRSAQMDTLRTKHFRAESICLVFQNIQHRTEYSHLCLPPGLQSLDSAQMSKRRYIVAPLLLLALFLTYQVSITLFTHVHIVNGVMIVHSHPSSEKHHTHTTGQVITGLLCTFSCSTIYFFSSPNNN